MEADSVDLQNEWTLTGAEITVWVNFDLLQDRTLEARARRDQVVRRERGRKKKKARESDADHARRRRRREKEHQEVERQAIAETALPGGADAGHH